MMHGDDVRPIFVNDFIDYSVPALDELSKVRPFKFRYQTPDTDLFF